MGKTLLCKKLAEKFSSSGLMVSGILSIKRTENRSGRKIFAQIINSKEEREIAVFEPGWDADFPIRDWRLNQENLEWADKMIRNLLPADVIIIDELGYLEFEMGRGLVSGIDILESGEYMAAFVVIRTSLIKAAREKIQIHEVIHINQSTDIEKTANNLFDQVLNR